MSVFPPVFTVGYLPVVSKIDRIGSIEPVERVHRIEPRKVKEQPKPNFAQTSFAELYNFDFNEPHKGKKIDILA